MYIEKLNLLPSNLKTKFRRTENLIKKLINAEWSIVFNKTCLKDIYIYIYNVYEILYNNLIK